MLKMIWLNSFELSSSDTVLIIFKTYFIIKLSRVRAIIYYPISPSSVSRKSSRNPEISLSKFAVQWRRAVSRCPRHTALTHKSARASARWRTTPDRRGDAPTTMSATPTEHSSISNGEGVGTRSQEGGVRENRARVIRLDRRDDVDDVDRWR